MYYIPELSRYCNDVNPKYKSVEEARKNGEGRFGSKICVVYPLLGDDPHYGNRHYDHANTFYIIDTEAEYK